MLTAQRLVLFTATRLKAYRIKSGRRVLDRHDLFLPQFPTIKRRPTVEIDFVVQFSAGLFGA